MRVTILQTDTKWAQPEANRYVAESLMCDTSGSDIYILPEMWTTGFIMSPEQSAESMTAPNGSLEWMKRMSTRFNCAVCGSIAIRDDENKFRNRHFFVNPDGTFNFYDKRHLFAYGGENKYYEPGDTRVIVNFRGMRFMLATCYDLRFPVWLRNNNDYDAILITANWPESRHEAWNLLLRARAIENQCFVVAANRTGNDPCCSYRGDSMIIDAKGHVLAQAENNTEQTVTAELDADELKRFRTKFPVLDDRDGFKLITR